MSLNYLSLFKGSEPPELSGRSEGLTRAEQTGKDLKYARARLNGRFLNVIDFISFILHQTEWKSTYIVYKAFVKSKLTVKIW